MVTMAYIGCNSSRCPSHPMLSPLQVYCILVCYYGCVLVCGRHAAVACGAAGGEASLAVSPD